MDRQVANPLIRLKKDKQVGNPFIRDNSMPPRAATQSGVKKANNNKPKNKSQSMFQRFGIPTVEEDGSIMIPQRTVTRPPVGTGSSRVKEIPAEGLASPDPSVSKEVE